VSSASSAIAESEEREGEELDAGASTDLDPKLPGLIN
jgi:hypothetical protein